MSSTAEVGLEQDSICLVVLKRRDGLLLALPHNSIAEDVLLAAQNAGPDEVFGPSALVEVASGIWNLELPMVEPYDEGREIRIQVLLVDLASSVADHLKDLADCDLLDVRLFAEDITLFPLPESILDAAMTWVHAGGADPRVAFYSAEEELPGGSAVEEPPVPKQRARLRPPGGTASEPKAPQPKKRATVASLAESIDKMAAAIPNLANQVKVLSERTERLERGENQGASPSNQHIGSLPTLVASANAEQEAIEIAQDLIPGDSSELAKALFAQSSAITSLVSQIASSSGDPLQDLTTGGSLSSSRGASGRAKLQQELALHKGSFFNVIFQQMSRRMYPALPADLAPQELAARGVTTCLYLERFGGFGKSRHLGQVAWQVALALDHLQMGNTSAAKDTLALLMVCLEQTVMDGGNMQIGLLLALTEEPPQAMFSNRSLAVGGRPRAFAPLADQRWVTTALQYLKELDTITSRRAEVATPTAKAAPAREDAPASKRKAKGKRRQSQEAGRGRRLSPLLASSPLESLKCTITFRQFVAALPRWILKCRTPFSSFLARSLHALPSGLGPSSAVFPIPLAHFGLFRGSGPQLPGAKWWTLCRNRLLHIMVVALNYLHFGLRHIEMTELGRAPSAVHRAIYRRLRASITACDTPGQFPLPPGRAGPEFIARLFDLEEFARSKDLLKIDPYQNDVGFSSDVLGKTKPSHPPSSTPSDNINPLNPYRSLQADRLKLSGNGQWPIQDFLEDELWLPFLEPKVIALPPQRGAVGPDFRRETKEENLKLAQVWNVRGLLSIFHQAPKYFCRVFNAHKNSEFDRQIGDRRWWNAHERHLRGPSSLIPDGPMMTSLHCPKGATLRGAISDRKDFYHQCEASRSRAFTNCLPFPFKKEHFANCPAYEVMMQELRQPTQREVHGDRYGLSPRKVVKDSEVKQVYCGFKSLFQGDHLGVEYALSAHETLLKRAGLLCDGSHIQRHVPFPEGPLWEGLVIDDPAAALSVAEEAYRAAGVIGSDEKTIRGSERFKVIGTEIGSDQKCRGAGVVSASAPLEKRFSLAALSLRIACLPIISRDIASRLAGSWISTLMFRRPMTCLLHTLFSFGVSDEKEARDVLQLPRKTADELVLASALSALCFTDLSTPYSQKIYATDASLARGAVCSCVVDEEISKLVWLGGDRKGGYTKLDSNERAILRSVGEFEEETFEEGERTGGHLFGPYKTVEFIFDFVEICGGSGSVSAKAAQLGLSVCPPIDLSNSPHFDLTNIDLLWWILGMIKSGRFRSVCCEPPCTTFSAAQHPASRSYKIPLGFNRKDPKTLLGNILAFRCFVICWYAFRCDCPSLLETPKLSKMAWLSIWKYLLSIGFEEACLASCRFGSPHKKEFRFLLQGLERDFLDLRCRGGHSHLKIEGKYTKASGEYVSGVAERIALAFHRALKQSTGAKKEKSLQGLESVVLDDLLSAGEWRTETFWSWQYPSPINVYESYSLVALLRRLVQEGGDMRFSALLDSRVAKGALAKGRSSSNALRGSLQRACALQLAGNLHPSLGFAPTRLNTADAPTRFSELPKPSKHSICQILSLDILKELHRYQFSKPAANWIRLFILLVAISPSDGLHAHQGSRLESGHWTFGFSGPAGSLSPSLDFDSAGFWIFLLSALFALLSCHGFSTNPHNGLGKHKIQLGLITSIALLLCSFGAVAEAMPLAPFSADDRKRAAERISVELRPDRTVKATTRVNRDKLLESFDLWIVEHFATTLHELLFGVCLDPDYVSEILVAYGKDLFQSGRSYSKYAETINGVTALRPTLRRQLAAAWDLAFNWVVSEPHEHHAALPLSILLALSGLALLWGWVREACVLLMTWTGLLRIGEVFAAVRSDLILPRDAAPGMRSCLLKIHQPKTRGRSAKHQVAKIDFPDVIALLDAVFGRSDPLEKIWPMSPQAMRSKFKQLQSALGLKVSREGGHVPYELSSLRPGGATFYLTQTEDGEYVRRKGRWLSTKVLEIYIQEAVAATSPLEDEVAMLRAEVNAQQQMAQEQQALIKELLEEVHQPRQLQTYATSAELATQVAALQATDNSLGGALDSAWMCLCGALVMFMHAGFGMLETGSCRAKNASNVLMKNLVNVCVGTLGCLAAELLMKCDAGFQTW
eukprot:s4316_g1.t1